MKRRKKQIALSHPLLRRPTSSTMPGVGALLKKFAIVLAGGTLAADYRKIAPWTQVHARNCIRKIYRQARQLTFDAPEAAVYLAMRLQADHKAGYIPQVGKGSVFPKGKRGFARIIDGDKCFAVTMERTERIVGPKVLDSVVAETAEKGNSHPRGGPKEHPSVASPGL